MKPDAVTAWQNLAGMGPGGTIGVAINAVRLVKADDIAVALEELDRRHFLGQERCQPQHDDEYLRFYRSTRRILTTLADLRQAIEPERGRLTAGEKSRTG